MKMSAGVKQASRAYYLIPSLFTLTNLYLGYLSIAATFDGRYRWAAVFIIIAAVMDGLDGLVARLIRASSDFGIQLDSLSDAVSFGLATAILIHVWGLYPTGAKWPLLSFLFLTAGVLRLARYNIRTKSQPDRKTYQGLTVPSAAMFISSLVFAHPEPLQTHALAFILGLIVVIVAFFMVSTMRYPNLLSFSPRKKIDARSILVLAVFLGGLVLHADIFLVAFFTLNVLSGPVLTLARFLLKRAQRKKSAPQAA
jgi:CDP-diacylglycerol---serine O-phosphatidyltransferase